MPPSVLSIPVPVTEVTALPAEPVAYRFYTLIQEDTIAKAGPGIYMHDGAGWICIQCFYPYDWGNMGATPTLTLIPGCDYIFTQDQEITECTIEFTNVGVVAFTKIGEFDFAPPTMNGVSVYTRTETGWDDSGGSAVEGCFRYDGFNLWISAVLGVGGMPPPPEPE